MAALESLKRLGVRVGEKVQPRRARRRRVDVVVPELGIDAGDGVGGVDGDAEEEEAGVGGDDPGSRGGEVGAGAVGAEVGEGRRVGGAEGHMHGLVGRRP